MPHQCVLLHNRRGLFNLDQREEISASECVCQLLKWNINQGKLGDGMGQSKLREHASHDSLSECPVLQAWELSCLLYYICLLGTLTPKHLVLYLYAV